MKKRYVIMKNGKKRSTAATLYLMTSVLWLVVAAMNAVNGQFGYAAIEVVIAALCIVLAKRKRGEK
jgi:hypothetical protein